MNSIPLLIIGAPCVLAVIAFKKAQKDEDDNTGDRKPDWQWPKKWHPPVAKTGAK